MANKDQNCKRKDNLSSGTLSPLKRIDRRLLTPVEWREISMKQEDDNEP